MIIPHTDSSMAEILVQCICQNHLILSEKSFSFSQCQTALHDVIAKLMEQKGNPPLEYCIYFVPFDVFIDSEIINNVIKMIEEELCAQTIAFTEEELKILTTVYLFERLQEKFTFESL